MSTKNPNIPEDLIRRILRTMMNGIPADYFDADDLRKEAVRIVRVIRRYDAAKRKRNRG